MPGNLIHGPTPGAWLVVAAYFAGAVAAFLAARSAVARRERRLWLAMAILLVLLGLGKQLDLQVPLTGLGRSLARSGGWYESRKAVQAAFVALLALASLGAGAVLLRWTRRSGRFVKIAALGASLLFAFIVARAASIHQVDRWVTREVGGVRIGWWLELAGIAVIGLSAVAYRFRRR